MNREEHLMSIAAEECNEVAQRIIKAMRFGVDEVQVEQTKNNSERIVQEWIDLLAMFEMLEEEGLVSLPLDLDTPIATKKAKVEKYLKYSNECGTLND